MINEKVKSFFLFQNFNKVKIFFSTLAHNDEAMGIWRFGGATPANCTELVPIYLSQPANGQRACVRRSFFVVLFCLSVSCRYSLLVSETVVACNTRSNN